MKSWLRRVVPDGYALATLQLEGTSPLLMKSGEFDPDGEQYRAFVTLGQKRGKSLDDQARLRELEWKLGLYLDEDLGPYIPGKNVKELLRSAATKWRKGEELKRSLIVVENRIPLVYDGPRDEAGLLNESRFYYDAMVANAGAGSGRVQRRRPMFEEWSLEAELAYDPEDLDFDFLGIVTERAQKYGIGDGRSIGFGAFSSSLVAGVVHKDSVNGSALKRRDATDESAHRAARQRIMA
jgi:hypothetical protein